MFDSKRRFFGFLIFLFSQNIFAQTNMHKLESVVTTGNALETPIAKIPGNISVVE